MKQMYKKKPEYLNVVEVLDDSQSIKDIYEITESFSGIVSFDEEGNRVVTLDDGTKIPVGVVVFKDKKGSLVVIPKEKLLQVYDPYEGE